MVLREAVLEKGGGAFRFKKLPDLPHLDKPSIDPANEFVTQLDPKGHIIGAISKEAAHGREKPIHGGARVIVIDNDGRVYLPKRSVRKRSDPGTFDYGAGEHLTVTPEGIVEGWNAAAKRGMKEELQLGTADYELVRLPGHRLDETGGEREFATYYIAILHPGIVPQPNPQEIDVEGSLWASVDDVLEVIEAADPDRVSNTNPLKGQTLRPMLRKDLQEVRSLRNALRQYLSSD